MAKLDPGQMLQGVKDSSVRALFQQLIDGINNLSDHVGADPVGNKQPPSPLQGITVKNAGELIHIALTHNSPMTKGVRYFTEYDTDPGFPQPQVIHMGTSRTVPPFTLPSKDDNGVALSYYFRAYPQHPGSEPGPVTVFGGGTPTAVIPGGATQMTLVPSTGSGTASPSGQQGGYGFGKFLVRQPQGPKRNIPL
jgi:hypothetical protein